ncbi:DNA repair exonuclease [Alkalihalobacillus sp. BA299]|uniref:metallophosphoesterase family protein n=1 Tax=Alkalihalobacillus sp. BA299 TaxID=2815938 RepID=UPI001ADAA311|nr:DNA repair exonuclease [Alkalihalobacillus sp. BA299]
MRRLRFIHTADLHLDSPFKGLTHLPESLLHQIHESSFQSFRKVIDTAIQENVDFVIISGDLYDSDQRSLKAQLFLRKEFARLDEENIPVYIIHGNHDHLNGKWVSVNWTKNVHVFSSEIECKHFVARNGTTVHLYGFSYRDREVFERKVSFYKKIAGVDYHIGLLHGQEQTMSGHNPYAPFHWRELEEKEFDYWALGHIHQLTQLKPSIFYPGNIQGRHRKETGKKGCLLVEIVEKKDVNVQFYETAPVIWGTIEVSINKIKTAEQFFSYCEQVIDNQRLINKNTMLHLHFTGEGSASEIIDEAGQMEEWIEYVNGEQEYEDGFVWICSYENDTKKKWDINELKKQEDFLGDITRVTEQLVEGSYEDVKEILKELYRHRKARHFLQPLNEEEYKKLIQNGRDVLLKELLKEWG